MEAFIIQAIEERLPKPVKYLLPINKIDGFGVRVFVQIKAQSKLADGQLLYAVYLSVESDKFEEHGGEPYILYVDWDMGVWTSDTAKLAEDLTGYINNLQLLRLNQLLGNFSVKPPAHSLLTVETFKIIKGFEQAGFEKTIDECSVCYCPTMTELNCNHRVCLRCLEQLPRRFCPMCRAVITSIGGF